MGPPPLVPAGFILNSHAATRRPTGASPRFGRAKARPFVAPPDIQAERVAARRLPGFWREAAGTRRRNLRYAQGVMRRGCRHPAKPTAEPYLGSLGFLQGLMHALEVPPLDRAASKAEINFPGALGHAFSRHLGLDLARPADQIGVNTGVLLYRFALTCTAHGSIPSRYIPKCACRYPSDRRDRYGRAHHSRYRSTESPRPLLPAPEGSDQLRAALEDR